MANIRVTHCISPSTGIPVDFPCLEDSNKVGTLKFNLQINVSGYETIEEEFMLTKDCQGKKCAHYICTLCTCNVLYVHVLYVHVLLCTCTCMLLTLACIVFHLEISTRGQN